MNDHETQVNTDLKAERVQESFGMAPAPPATSGLKAERVQERLRALPGWQLVPGGRAIDRIRVFADPGVAEAYAVFVARLARSERQAVTIDLAASQVIVSLYGHVHEVVIGELNEAAFDLAATIG
jgi:pterin-4a-carbinolamine dehydratase